MQAPTLGQRHLHHLLALRARDQHAAVDEEIEVAERPVAEDVLERLSRRPACRHGARRPQGAGGNLVRTSAHALDPAASEHLVDDEAGLVTGPAQRGGQLVGQLPPRHPAPSSSPAS